MAARSHSLVFVVVISDTAEGQFPPIYQDRFGTHFRGKICWKAFSRKKVPKSGDRHGTRNSPTTASLRSHLPKAFPLGGRCPSAHTGADEGAILYPTFPCRKEGGSRLSPQRKFSSAPLGNPVAPSSVTSGDSFPPRGSLWVVQPYTKKAPQIRARTWAPYQPHYRSAAPRHAKTSEWERAGPKKGGAGALPRDSLRPGFL